jgi:hypothetical protein
VWLCWYSRRSYSRSPSLSDLSHCQVQLPIIRTKRPSVYQRDKKGIDGGELSRSVTRLADSAKNLLDSSDESIVAAGTEIVGVRSNLLKGCRGSIERRPSGYARRGAVHCLTRG